MRDRDVCPGLRLAPAWLCLRYIALSLVRIGCANLMSSTRMTLLVGTTKGAFLISGGSDRSGWTVQGPHCDGWPINHIVGDPTTGTIWAGGGGDWHGAGVWRSEDGGDELAGHPADQGQDGRLGGQRPGFRQDDRLDRRAAAIRRRLLADLVALLRPRHGSMPAPSRRACCRASTAADLGTDRGPDRAPLGRQLEPRCCGPRPAHDRVRPVQPEKALGRHLGRGRLRHRGRRRDLGAPQPPLERRGQPSARPPCRAARRRDRALRPQHDARAGHRATCSTSRTITASGARRTAAAAGTTSPRACPRPSAFRSASIRAIRTRIWTLPLNGDMAGRFPPDAAAAVWRSRDGGQSWQAMRARFAAGQAVSSPCSVRRWRATNAIQPASTSAPTVARSSRASTKARPGKRSPVTCQRYLLSKYSNGDNICRSTTMVSSSVSPRFGRLKKDRLWQIVLRKSPRRRCRIENCNRRIEASAFVNQCCSIKRDLESMSLADMLKIVSQHYRASLRFVAARKFSRFRSETDIQRAGLQNRIYERAP